MKIIFLSAFSVLFFTIAEGQSGLSWFYTGTFTSEGAAGVYLCSFDQGTGDIKHVNTFKGFDDPSFLKISPDRKFLYVVNRAPQSVEPSGGYVAAFRIEKDRSLAFINKQLTHGDGPCYVEVSSDGKFVGAANYNSGSFAVFKVGEEGAITPATAFIQNEGKSIDRARQTGPHAHSIRFSARSNEVFIPDLGIDQVMRFELDKNTGLLKQSGQPYLKLAPGAGPRHMEFHPLNDIIYVISELNSTITCFRKSGDAWEEFQVISTLPPNYTGTSYCADIHFSRDGKFLYGSNRGHNSIAVFRVETSNGKLIPKGYVPTEGNWPRNFAISPDGGFLLVGNQKSGNITVFRINRETGMPEYTGKELKLPSPVCIEFL
jgi:6-phosphogluconolactonase